MQLVFESRQQQIEGIESESLFRTTMTSLLPPTVKLIKFKAVFVETNN